MIFKFSYFFQRFQPVYGGLVKLKWDGLVYSKSDDAWWVLTIFHYKNYAQLQSFWPLIFSAVMLPFLIWKCLSLLVWFNLSWSTKLLKAIFILRGWWWGWGARQYTKKENTKLNLTWFQYGFALHDHQTVERHIRVISPFTN